jgi:hypothetical protein
MGFPPSKYLSDQGVVNFYLALSACCGAKIHKEDRPEIEAPSAQQTADFVVDIHRLEAGSMQNLSPGGVAGCHPLE